MPPNTTASVLAIPKPPARSANDPRLEVQSIEAPIPGLPFLLDALGEEEPEAALVARIGRVLDASVVLQRPASSLKTAGPVPDAELWRDAPESGSRSIEAAGWYGIVSTVPAAAGSHCGVLVVASRWDERIAEKAKRLIGVSIQLLIAAARLLEIKRENDRAERGSVLASMLNAVSTAEVVETAARAERFGIDVGSGGPATVACMRSASTEDDLARVIALQLDVLGAPYLLSARDDDLLILLHTDPKRVRAIFDSLMAEHPQFVVGIGRSFSDIGELRVSLGDAKLAVERAVPDSDAAGRIVDFANLDLATLLVCESRLERTRPKLQCLVDALRSNEMAFEAVTAYFDNNLDINKTAKAIFLHPNSVRYRLSRFETAIDASLREPSTIASLYLAITSERITAP